MIIATPTASHALLPIDFVKSLLALPHNYTHVFEESCSIPDNRNKLFELAKARNEDLLFVDSDMVFTRSDVERMEENLKTHDIVSGVAVMQFAGWPAAIFNDELKTIPVVGDELFEIGASGAAFLGISKRILNDLSEPFNQIDDEHGKKHGEDISFCLRARRAGYKIHCDPLLRIGHIKSQVKYYGSR